MRATTHNFGLDPANGIVDGTTQCGSLSDKVVIPGRLDGAFCARSGFFFPGEQLTVDAYGRTVGRRFKTYPGPIDSGDWKRDR